VRSPEFERMLVRSGIRLLKYWFSITAEEQHLRFLGRIHDPLKQWKLSPMDLESRRRWEESQGGHATTLSYSRSALVGRAGRR
jgi:polyphosphate kinase 2 (PPK2 family)